MILPSAGSNPAASSMNKCELKALTHGYKPCRRRENHSGPCAHEFTTFRWVVEWLKTQLWKG